MKSRSQAVAGIRNLSFDVCVIGGGATGAGCALDSELRGLKTVLLEASDFASATSSASTKLVHGGLRYLQQAVAGCDFGQYRVVRRALRERRLMLENAPFLAHPLELLVPCFRRSDVFYFRAALKLYDWIAGSDGLAPSRYLPPEDALARLPLLNASGLAGAIAYTDGQFDDARYGLTLVKTFVERGGSALNYARVIGFNKNSDGKLCEVLVEDRLSGERFSVCAKAFLNATGPFSDQQRRLANPRVPARLRLSKGVHILLPLTAGSHPSEPKAGLLGTPSQTDALLIPHTDDGRVIFAIPWQGRLLVGTTDDETTMEEELTVKQTEVEYLLRHLNRYLQTPYSIGQVESAIAGLRPLVSHGEACGSSKLIRDHEVELDRESGLISILGGKWTTYRAMAEDAVNAAQQYLLMASASQPNVFGEGGPAGRGGACATRHFALLGSEGWKPEFWQTLVQNYRIPPQTARHLAGKFGTRAVEVLELARADRNLAAPIVAEAPPIQAEIVYAIRCEMATCIEDVLARRIGLQWFGWRLAMAAAPVAGAYLAQEYGWSADETAQAVRDYTLQLTRLSAIAGVASERAVAV